MKSEKKSFVTVNNRADDSNQRVVIEKELKKIIQQIREGFKEGLPNAPLKKIEVTIDYGDMEISINRLLS